MLPSEKTKYLKYRKKNANIFHRDEDLYKLSV